MALVLLHLDSLVMTRIKAPFSSFNLWFSNISSSLACSENAQSENTQSLKLPGLLS